MPSSLDPTIPLLMIIGAFYSLAGLVAVRAGLSERLLDIALSRISLSKPDRRDVLRQIWLLIASIIILAGGLALLIRWDLAALLFAGSALLQIVYLLVAAPYYFDAIDPPDAKGRAGTTNAAILYAAATAFVLWSYAQGKLFEFAALPPLAIAAVATIVLAYAAYAFWNFTFAVKNVGRGPSTDYDTPVDDE